MEKSYYRRSWDDGEFMGGGNGAATPSVDEAAKPKWSGLYNAQGQPLYREKNPVGFDTSGKK